jgi:hypothetical protein
MQGSSSPYRASFDTKDVRGNRVKPGTVHGLLAEHRGRLPPLTRLSNDTRAP